MEIPTTHNVQDAQEINMKSDKEKNDQLAAAIMAAIDSEANFKLYSYRVISAESFLERQREISQLNLKHYK